MNTCTLASAIYLEAILRVIIVSNTLVSQMILDNFFALVDSDLDKNSSR